MQVQEDVMMAREKLMGSILAMKKGKGEREKRNIRESFFRFMCFLIFSRKGRRHTLKAFFNLLLINIFNLSLR